MIFNFLYIYLLIHPFMGNNARYVGAALIGSWEKWCIEGMKERKIEGYQNIASI